ncbi:MAG TPA: HAMP domain-containing sensor histidine kinase [Pyrinomonadaceae bacterium]|nr:HAMP domain-containing sensor histidine kinase [Pyrinomonadaceae bacterium]
MPLLVLSAALVVLLVLLAALQYRWLGQVSDAERVRMQSTTSAGASRFSQDFDRELGRVYFGLQMDADAWRARDGDRYAARFEQWRKTTPHTELLRDVYVVEDNAGGGEARLARFDPATRSFASASSWPAGFDALRRRFAQAHESALKHADDKSFAPQPTVDLEIPAVIIPIIPAESLPGVKDRTTARDDTVAATSERKLVLTNYSPLGAYVVATLDLDYVKRELWPALTRRYFASGDRLDYRVAVVDAGDPSKIIYNSAPDVRTNAQSSGDARAPIFQVRFDEMDAFLPPSFTSPPASDSQVEQVQETTGTQRKKTVRIFESKTSRELTRLHLPGAGEGGWQLVVTHAAGSLDAAVGGARRRSLLVSFGILLLLAASVALIFVSTHRAQRLARRQVEFVAGVTHELRTPLAVICSAGENLADGVIDDRKQVRRYGQVIHSEGRRLAEMVEQVLEFAGAESGRHKLELAPVEVSSLVERALASYRATTMNEAAFEIERDVPADLPTVMADAAALSRSLQNLLSNAAKYGGEDRWIKLSAHTVANGRGAEVQIRVEDRGLGIAPGDLPHIFEPFYRGREAVAAQIHGNGLGLSLVKHIVEAHGGRVSVRSEPGRGSQFTMHLPVAVAAKGNGNGHARGGDA